MSWWGRRLERQLRRDTRSIEEQFKRDTRNIEQFFKQLFPDFNFEVSVEVEDIIFGFDPAFDAAPPEQFLPDPKIDSILDYPLLTQIFWEDKISNIKPSISIPEINPPSLPKPPSVDYNDYTKSFSDTLQNESEQYMGESDEVNIEGLNDS